MSRHGAHDALILSALASGKYRIEPDGKVINLTFRRGSRFKVGGGCRPLGQWVNPYGYSMCEIAANGVRSCVFVHRMVAFAFLPFAGNSSLLDVNHLDGIKSNNSAANLQWCERSENVKHAWDSGLKRKFESPCIWRKGASHPGAKLSAEDVRQIRVLLSAGALQREVAEQFGITQSHVSSIKRGKSWLSQEIKNEPQSA